MASISRVSIGMRWGLRHQLQLQRVSSPKQISSLNRNESVSDSTCLLSKLLQESDSRVKMALDLEQDLMPKTNASFWESLVAALRSSSPKKAQLVLEWKLDRLLMENNKDYDHYLELISLCGKVHNISFAIQVFTSLEAQGIRPNVVLFNTLISACLLAGNVITAFSLFEIMERTDDCKPDLASYNSFISAYSKMGDAKAMEAWYLAGKAAGCSPDVLTFDFLIAGFVKVGRFDDADRFFEEMILSGMTPNETILGSVLEGLCKQKKIGEVKEFLNFLKDGGWDVTAVMIDKILMLYSELGKLEEMEELLILVKSNKTSGVLAQVHSGIIRLHALWDRLDDMEHSIERMLKEGILFTCPVDIEAVICSYFRRAAYERLDLFLDQIRGLYKLPKSTLDLLVAGYRRAELSEKLDLLMKDLKNAGLS
ncbi:pentatricopeptide repeat-containing-like protein isoform X2 [Cinnamomum micranthum f. kanehirae]|uniref:Pentatricopeptide repeat-containing-like protein isoform X2 n=1 Tax=Cinnamomum micranthum f. kanehirae TaxID=337451 RepID=A0A443P3T1_9MAGN|nr:pentatricopeptide repeat-containing-like protein isoform X2 [Cinnamomum micranthum f. kanehirae]